MIDSDCKYRQKREIFYVTLQKKGKNHRHRLRPTPLRSGGNRPVAQRCDSTPYSRHRRTACIRRRLLRPRAGRLHRSRTSARPSRQRVGIHAFYPSGHSTSAQGAPRDGDSHVGRALHLSNSPPVNDRFGNEPHATPRQVARRPHGRSAYTQLLSRKPPVQLQRVTLTPHTVPTPVTIQ